MPKTFTITASLVWTNERCIKAMTALLEEVESLHEDWPHHEGVRRAYKAAGYLQRHVGVDVHTKPIGKAE